MSEQQIQKLLEKSRALREQGKGEGAQHAEHAYSLAQAVNNHPLTIDSPERKKKATHCTFTPILRLSKNFRTNDQV